jgi:hypothetical protein
MPSQNNLLTCNDMKFFVRKKVHGDMGNLNLKKRGGGHACVEEDMHVSDMNLEDMHVSQVCRFVMQ